MKKQFGIFYHDKEGRGKHQSFFAKNLKDANKQSKKFKLDIEHIYEED